MGAITMVFDFVSHCFVSCSSNYIHLDTFYIIFFCCIFAVTPEIDKSPEYNKAASQTGRTGKLVCKAEGAPTVAFKWQKVHTLESSVQYV